MQPFFNWKWSTDLELFNCECCHSCLLYIFYTFLLVHHFILFILLLHTHHQINPLSFITDKAIFGKILNNVNFSFSFFVGRGLEFFSGNGLYQLRLKYVESIIWPMIKKIPISLYFEGGFPFFPVVSGVVPTPPPHFFPYQIIT